MLVLSILLILAAVVLYFVARARASSPLRLGAIAALAGGAFFGIASCVYVVSAYEVGVPVLFGKVGTPMTSGMHLKAPFTDVTSFSTRPVDLNLSLAVFQPITCLTCLFAACDLRVRACRVPVFSSSSLEVRRAHARCCHQAPTG
ncbi:hypothetical protein [Streptomyces sp. 11x1]|uniref:hypothetical protein n=1 Tax=Streptomyces sp. 11x1 TaxID=3038642 RepID=UPI00292E5868|nr:hypothetical protein [Streptomyces sp. 11x1]WNZ06369.1 hypothetical protein P8T65_01305 [Streptomyces sp. 11x1]